MILGQSVATHVDGLTHNNDGHSSGEVVLNVPGASAEDVDKAVASARKAFEGPWGELSNVERARYVFKLASLIDRDRELLAAIDSYDCGKPYAVSLEADLDESYNVFQYYAGWADKIDGKTIDTSPEKLAYTVQEPLGVCGQIIPWNFPFMMLAWKVAPALACGNTVVLKPAEQTPLSAMYFGKMVQEAGIPPGVVNVVPGLGPVAGKALAEHTGVDKIAFTGSTATGRTIMKAAATNLKNITLECGGKSPLLVFEDADIEKAVMWSHGGIMDNAGQVCTSTSRIYVHEKIYDKFLDEFAKYAKNSKVVDGPFGKDVTHGPQVSKAQYDRVLSYIEEGKKEGAKALIGGEAIQRDGYFIEPTVFTDVSPVLESESCNLRRMTDKCITGARVSKDCQGGDIRPCCDRRKVRKRRRSGCKSQRHSVRPRRGLIYDQYLESAQGSEETSGWHGMDQLFW